MDKTFDDIKDMLKANYPLLYLATSEYGRALQKLRRRRHTIWTMLFIHGIMWMVYKVM